LLSLPMRERGLKFASLNRVSFRWVAPHAGAWIEICQLLKLKRCSCKQVAPHAGAWIEIFTLPCSYVCISWPSLPMRERGLKYQQVFARNIPDDLVAPHAGAWIEIPDKPNSLLEGKEKVAPHAGAWIEIGASRDPPERRSSLPMRERGLK
jgi:hypothetical protein